MPKNHPLRPQVDLIGLSAIAHGVAIERERISGSSRVVIRVASWMVCGSSSLASPARQHNSSSLVTARQLQALARRQPIVIYLLLGVYQAVDDGCSADGDQDPGPKRSGGSKGVHLG